MKKYLIGIDLGTSSVKTVLTDVNGAVIAQYSQDYPIITPKLGYAEQDPCMWWKAVKTTLKKVSGTVPEDTVKGIGLSGQMHGTVPVDINGKPVRNAVIWCDQRTEKIVNRLNKQPYKQIINKETYNRPAAGFMNATLMWLYENEPENMKKTHKVLLPKDYIRYKLTGKIATEVTDAASTLLLNVKKQKWSKKVCDATGIDINILPDIGYPCEIAGYITDRASKETGLQVGIPVTYGGADQPMQALGNGITKPGLCSVTIGTGGQVFAPVLKPVFDDEFRTSTFCNIQRDSWYMMGATLNAGLSLKWFCNEILRENDYVKLDKECEKVPPGSEGLCFLPYLTGERTPYFDPNAKGVFYGLTLRHTRAHMVRAIMEGVAFALLDSIKLIKLQGVPVNKVIASGGGAKSELWLQIQADVFGLKLKKSKNKEQACLGAAITAGVGTGMYKSINDACQSATKISDKEIVPNEENFNTYKKAYETYKDLYAGTKNLK